ncbi:hypothetical protein [Treponema sp.]|nr:hypothetical protein [Treponema sp.]
MSVSEGRTAWFLWRGMKWSGTKSRPNKNKRNYIEDYVGFYSE